MNIVVGNFTANVSEGTLKVHQAERQLVRTEITAAGVTTTTQPLAEAIPGLSKAPILKATWAGEGYANVDMDAGFQRWNGMKSLRYIRNGLCKVGFTKADVDALFAEMRKGGKQDYVGRVW